MLEQILIIIGKILIIIETNIVEEKKKDKCNSEERDNLSKPTLQQKSHESH